MSLSKSQQMVRIALFTTLTATGAYVVLPLPFTPVPFTLQLFFTLLSGLMLGPKNGALSQIVYLALGIVGVPVFAGGNAGVGALVGPTGGYLVGFVLAAGVVGYLDMRLASWGDSAIRRGVIIGTVGLGIIHGFGAWWLARATRISLAKAFALGCAPYIIPDSIKCVAALMAAAALKRMVPGYAGQVKYAEPRGTSAPRQR
ncbi:MAG: biotin transporter BioY [Firmicutes bacterium]|nr:biotin transporter BioY [Bacillota bacterium]